MEIQITQEQVDAAIEAVVRKELESAEIYDWDRDAYVTKSLHNYVVDKAQAAIDRYIEKKFDALIDDEVAEVARMEAMAAFLSKPVKITDGYRQSEYDSWSSYLLERIHEHSLSDWNVNRKIRDEIDRRVSRLWAECESKARAVAVASFSEGIEKMFEKEHKA
jgi:hypothetical protein